MSDPDSGSDLDPDPGLSFSCGLAPCFGPGFRFGRWSVPGSRRDNAPFLRCAQTRFVVSATVGYLGSRPAVASFASAVRQQIQITRESNHDPEDPPLLSADALAGGGSCPHLSRRRDSPEHRFGVHR